MIRIRGIVKAAESARNQLQGGIPADKVTHFQEFVASTIAQIQRICAEANVRPTQLPTPSRKAYEFLIQIDLKNLPVVDDRVASVLVHPIRLKNIRIQQQSLLQAIAKLTQSPKLEKSQKDKFVNRLKETVATIEQICARQRATPANLTTTSRQTYAWMKFLTDESNLERHLSATRRTRQMAEKILKRMHHSCENVVIEFTNMGHLYKGRINSSSASIQISEGFVNASDEVLEAVVTAGLHGKSKKINQMIREYALSEEYSEVQLELDLMADTDAENARGKWHDLDELFHKVNREYFGGKMEKPRITWNRAFTTRKFGHYERSRDRIVLSISLDSDRVPAFVVEFVLYHELLHKQHSEKWINGRLAVHTPEFRRDEQKFKKYKEADRWLTVLASQ